MSASRRLALAIEDPLEARPEPTVGAEDVPDVAEAPEASAPTSEPVVVAEPAQEAQETDASSPPVDEDEFWRNWGGTSRPASYRLPDDLLDELDERTHDLRLPIGLTVTAALLSLLDQDDETIVRLVDRAEEAQDRARRAARRRR